MRTGIVLALLTLAACGGKEGGTGTVSVASVVISPLPADFKYVGDSAQLTATVRDASGTVLSGRAVTWQSDHSDLISVTNGKVKGLKVGTATITATAEGRSGQLQAGVAVLPIASVALSRAAITVAVGGTHPLTASVLDARNNPVTDGLEWRSSDEATVAVSATGVVATVRGVAAGSATVTASIGGQSAQAQVTATTAPPPQIASIAPAVLTPGATAVITGSNFTDPAVSNLVTIDGVAAAVSAATSTQLTITVPPAGLLACAPTHNATVEVSAAGLTVSRAHPLQVAVQRTLAPGQSLVVLDPTETRCNELSQTGGAYLVSVFNTTSSLGSSRPAAFELHGALATAPSAAVATAGAPAAPGQRTLSLPRAGRADAAELRAELRERRRVAAAHRQDIDRERQLFRLVAPAIHRRARAGRAALLQRAAGAQLDVGTVGAMSAVNIPNRKRIQAGKNLCDTPPIKVRARTAYVGARAIILEDSLNVLFGQMDSYYQQIGEEFDNVMFPILTNNFGSPLAYDGETDNNGKILMLFSKQINDMGDIFGFVSACDLLDPAVNYGTTSQPFIPSASNKAEIFYAIAPTSTAAGYQSSVTLRNMSRDDWRRRVRGTTIHEAKHLTMFAERFASPTADTFEDAWLEEGTAMHAEELFARGVTGAQWKGNTPYGSASAPNFLYCEVRRPGTNGCPADGPVIMLDHFVWAYDYYSDVENRTMLGSVNGDASFYGSAWLFVRWLIDQHSSDPVLLKALVAEPHLTGVSNIQARAGRPFAELLGDFVLAVALDDRPGFAPARAELTVPSWNMYDNFAGLSADFSSQGIFTSATPLRTRPVTFGDFTIDVVLLQPGTASYVELTGTQGAKQLIELRSLSRGNADPALRIAIARVQ